MDLIVLASVTAASILSSALALLVVWAAHRYMRRYAKSVMRCVLLFAVVFSTGFVVIIVSGTGIAKQRYGYEGWVQLQLVAVTSLLGFWLSIFIHMLCTVYDIRVMQISSTKMKRGEWIPACITHVFTSLCVCFVALVGQNVCGRLT